MAGKKKTGRQTINELVGQDSDVIGSPTQGGSMGWMRGTRRTRMTMDLSWTINYGQRMSSIFWEGANGMNKNQKTSSRVESGNLT